MATQSWARLEPHARTTAYDVGLRAGVADPLWLLAQLPLAGELDGSDGGSPIVVEHQVEHTRLTTLAMPDGRTQVIDGPIEPMVEREPVLHQDEGRIDDWAARVRAGRDLEQALRAEAEAGGGGATDWVALMLAEAPFTPEPGPDPSPAEKRYVTLLSGRVIDGAKARAWAGAQLVAAEEEGAYRPTPAMRAWLDSLDDRWAALARPPWDDERLRYSFRVAASDVTLAAGDYDGSGIEWHSFDASSEPVAAPGDGGVAVRSSLASPVRFPGAPHDRFWELEDAAVHLGAPGAGATDLAKLFVLNLLIVASPDWMLAEVRVPVGSVARVVSVAVLDTFGVPTEVHGGAPPGRLYTSTGTDRLVVPHPPAAALRSRPRERIAIQRDEFANLVWGIEEIVPGDLGRGEDVVRGLHELDLLPPDVDEPYDGVWRLATPVPSGWFPYVANGDHQLLAAEFYDAVEGERPDPRGRILPALRQVFDGTVTRAGVNVTVVDQIAYLPGGRRVVWRGREVRPGRGEVSSGLRFDDTT